MRRPLSPNQRRRVEELVREKEERCGLCGSTGLRCEEDAATFVPSRPWAWVESIARSSRSPSLFAWVSMVVLL